MSYKTLLVHLDTSQRAQARLDVALRLARRFDAHLTGIFATFVPDPRSFYLMAGSADYFDSQRQTRDEQRAAIERLFHAELTRAGVEGQWLAPAEYANEAVIRASRGADLVIAGQADPEDPEAYLGDRFPEDLVMSSGRPVLVIPYAGRYDPLGDRVLIAWDGSREAARAVHDALPLLLFASRVSVVRVSTAGSPPKPQRPGLDIVDALARHGVAVDAAGIVSDADETAGNALLSYGADAGYDLVVMGAYGHARWQERMLGGVTRTMFESMTQPVLMSH
ncbi:universal stress protein [Paraburkholderia caballeronis]|uniref:Universal stress protein family protein n=1 Tax=Paraburkholderia caballeronis TaxID=416943 RepID=A0A1H7P4R5_9BURK|nr:universal stress protein [Paraburkholderia caballeronis]PXW25382.1 universal stress protein family protein [Paraburkholderia caballeronis]PXX00989.1 universal stress protein family protein [Paraburkholderia caballeronis]RAJ99658.1 universal stress protein family protein [Paraburkholderia caballeronis]SEE39638.1 Universal stress protein family protein [Paraburkholderia caballeronis]SEL30772.1 Universal stress protein family protein [Paraburkholderia caballeronis]